MCRYRSTPACEEFVCDMSLEPYNNEGTKVHNPRRYIHCHINVCSPCMVHKRSS